MKAFIDRFPLSLSDAALDERVNIPAQPIVLSGKNIAVDANRLEVGLSKVFLVDSQRREILREIVALSRTHAELNFVDERSYQERIYEGTNWETTGLPAHALTGHAGVGKTELVKALARVFPADQFIDIKGHIGIPLQSRWHAGAVGGDTLSMLVEPMMKGAFGANEPAATSPILRSRKTDAQITQLARLISYRNGVCLITVDEFQFVTQSEAANTKATALLLKLIGLGPRVIYCANFSLMHKLQNRNSQDQRRLLTRPLVLMPDRYDSADFSRFLRELQLVAPTALAFDVNGAAEMIHKYTYGVRSKVAALLVEAFRIAQARRLGSSVGLDDLRRAYSSRAYESMRIEVEILTSLDIGGMNVKGSGQRLDLVYPFDATPEDRRSRAVVDLESARSDREKRIQEKVIANALPIDRAAESNSLLARERIRSEPAKVVKIRQRPKWTPDSAKSSKGRFGDKN